MHQVVRAHTCFTRLTFTDWSDFVGLGWLLGRFVCVSFAFLLSTDQPVRSSYQPMTVLAYLHDCHCRYDERSTVQKKKMEVKLNWTVLTDRMFAVAPTGKSREQLYAMLFNRAARGSQKNPYEEKAYRGPDYREVQALGAMPRVDAVLQMPMCATGPGH